MLGTFLNRFKKILVVEDDDDLRGVVHDHLRQKGYRVLTAKNGDAALKTALHENPDVILLDLMLPGRDGLSFLGQLRQDPERGHAIPVIILTNLVETTERWERISALGIEDYVEKADFSLELVSSLVQKALKKKARKKETPKQSSPEFQAKEGSEEEK